VRDRGEARALALEAGVIHRGRGGYEWASAVALWRQTRPQGTA